MATVNIVPLSPGVRGPGLQTPGGGARVQREQISLGRQRLAASERESGQDRELRELALLLGAEQTQASLEFSREQLARQGDQFSAQLEQVRTEAQFEREQTTENIKQQLEGSLKQVEAQITANRKGQEEELKRDDLARRRSEMAAQVTNLDRILGDKVALAKAFGQQKAQEIEQTMLTAQGGFVNRVANLRTLMARAALDNEITPTEMERLNDGIDSFLNELGNTLSDTDLSLDARTGAAAFLGAADGQGFTAMRHFAFELFELSATDGVSKAQSKKIVGMADRLLDFEDVAIFEAGSITTAFTQELSRLSSGLEPLSQKSEIIEGAVRQQSEILGTQDVEARIEPQGPVDFTTERDTGSREQAFGRLTDILSRAGAQQPEPASGALFPGDAGADIRQRGIEREELREERTLTREETLDDVVQKAIAAKQAGEPFTFVGQALRAVGTGIGQDVSDIGGFLRGLISDLPGDTQGREFIVKRLKELKTQRDKAANRAKKGLGGANIPLQEIQELSDIADEIAALENMLRQGEARVKEGRQFTPGGGSRF